MALCESCVPRPYLFRLAASMQFERVYLFGEPLAAELVPPQYREQLALRRRRARTRAQATDHSRTSGGYDIDQLNVMKLIDIIHSVSKICHCDMFFENVGDETSGLTILERNLETNSGGRSSS